MKRYQIYYARLDPVEGSEIGKTRPCVIISRDLLNERLPTIVVCPLTSRVRPSWRSRLEIQLLGRAADICGEQIRVISKTRLMRLIGTLSDDDAARLRELLREMYVSE